MEQVDFTMHKPVQAMFLFEKMFKEKAGLFFEKFKVENPVLCIKNYVDLGKDFIIEYSNPESKIDWAQGNSNLVYSGFMLSLVDDDKSQLSKVKYAKFFKRFKFVEGKLKI